MSRQEAIALPEIRMLPYSVQPEDSCGESPGCTGGFSTDESHSIYDRVPQADVHRGSRTGVIQ